MCFALATKSCVVGAFKDNYTYTERKSMGSFRETAYKISIKCRLVQAFCITIYCSSIWPGFAVESEVVQSSL